MPSAVSLRRDPGGRGVVVPAVSFDRDLKPFLDRSAETTVHSVFPSTVNIVRNDMVMGIHCREEFFPGCVRLEPESFRVFRTCSQSLQAGDAVVTGEGSIRFIDHPVILDLTGSRLLSHHTGPLPSGYDICLQKQLVRLAALDGTFSQPAVPADSLGFRQHDSPGTEGRQAVALQLLPALCRSLLFATVCDFGHHDPLLRGAGSRLIGCMIEACRIRSPEAVLEAAGMLVGLGSGLTPAGDDILTGFLAATAIYEPEWIPDAFAASLVRAASGKTNSIAYTYIKLAAEGSCSSLVGDVIGALCGNDFGQLVECLVRLTGWGASSGLDTAIGIILGGGAAACR